MTNYKYKLEPYKGSSSRHKCPGCGQNTFAQYIDIETGEYVANHVGRCNREQKCTYHYTPKEHFEANGQQFKPLTFKPATPDETLKPSYISFETMKATLKAYMNNNFYLFLLGLYGRDRANKLASIYKIGTTKHYNGGTIFWQIDIEGKVRTGKIMAYNPSTGHRLKSENGISYSNWAHRVLKLPDFSLSQCLFGAHLLNLNPNKPVAIVESEKTAIIASIYLPDMIWLSCGGKKSLASNNKLNILKGRKVILYPDLGAFEEWKAIGDRYGFGISELLESKATPEQRENGLDLADFLLQLPVPPHKFTYRDGSTIDLTPEGYPAAWDLITL